MTMTKKEITALSNDFYDHANNNQLDKFYKKFSGKDSIFSRDTYKQLVQLSYNYFCTVEKNDPIPPCQNPQIDGPQSTAAHTLHTINQIAATHHIENKIIATGALTACVMQPNDVQMTKECLKRIKASTELLETFQDQLPQLGISKTYFGQKIAAVGQKI